MSDFRFHIDIPHTVYSLGRAQAGALLESLEAMGDGCGEPCERLRADLRRALAVTAAADPARDPEAPVCWACGQPAATDAGPGGLRHVCRTQGCARHGLTVRAEEDDTEE